MRWMLVCLLTGCAAPQVEEQMDVSVPSYSASDFAVCAACHLDDGAGIPGAFPPLRGRSAKMATLDGGRQYLITVISFGLMGTIRADGQSYAGVMPGHAGSMQADAIAAALNYLVFELNDDANAANNVRFFDTAEVSAVLADTAGGNPMTASQLRNALVERHGERWPR